MRDFAKFYTHSVSDTMFIEAFGMELDASRCTFFLTNHGISYPVRAEYDKSEGVYKAAGTRFIRGDSRGVEKPSFYTEFILIERDGLYTIYGEWVETDGVRKDEYMYKMQVEV